MYLSDKGQESFDACRIICAHCLASVVDQCRRMISFNRSLIMTSTFRISGYI